MGLCWSLCFLILVYWGLPVNCVEEVVVYNFQENGIASNKTFAIYEKPIYIDFTNTTLCFWFSINYLRGVEQTYGCMLTMSTRDQFNAMSFCLLPKNEGVFMEILFVFYGINAFKSYRGTSIFEVSGIELRKWHHLCATFSVLTHDSRSDIFLYLNGKIVKNWSVGMETKFKIMDTKVEVLPVMGQDQDSFGGGFQADQSYSGKLADLRVMDRVLEHSELNRMNPCDLGAGWALLDTWVTTNVDTAVEISDYFCSHHYHKNYFISTQYVDFNQSKEVCDLIQGTLPLPETEKDLQDMSDLFMDILSNLHASFLLGYIFQPGDKKWYNVYTDKPVSDTNFINEHIREDIHCFMKWPAEKDFYPISCKQRQAAIFCKVKEEFRLYLKGLCSDEQKMEELLFDDWFYIQGVKNGRSHFRGTGQSDLYFDSEIKQWKIRSHVPPFPELVMENTGLNFTPFGRKLWKIVSTRVYLCGHRTNTTHYLTLSTCFPDKFTCNDGACIPLSKRCDTKLNCEDGSDESGCNYVVFNDQYVKEIAPIDRDQNNLNVFFNVSILDIPYIDTYEMKLTVSFVLNLRWQDFRLMFQNLNENSDLNSLSKEDRDALWKPNIVIDNALGKGGIEYNDRTISKVITQSSANPEVKHYATEAKIFPGHGNYIHMTQKLYEELTCQFFLENYPFDTQACKISFYLPSGLNLLIDGNGVDILSSRYLVEYQIMNIMAEKQGMRNNTSNIIILLRRRMEYHLFNTFLQIALLLVVGKLSLYFHPDNFSDRIMVTLTSLLVLVTIMSSIQGDLPKTNYFKLIDIWLLFSVSYLCFIMMFHTHIAGLQRPRSPNSRVGSAFWTKQEDFDTMLCKKIQRRNCQGKIFFALFFVGFFIAFSFRAMYVYYNADYQNQA